MSAICSHLGTIAVTELPDEIAGCVGGLAVGSRWLTLRTCEAWGHVGCCDQSPHRLARAHVHATSHAIIRSAETGEDWGDCFVDDVTFVLTQS